jgi:hypothetical protein
MKWCDLAAHAAADPHWAIGLMMTARRAGEVALPLMQRLTIALGPMIITGVVAAGGSLFGVYVAAEKRFTAIEYGQTELKTLLNSRIEQRNSELSSLRQTDIEHANRLAAVETLQRICGENLAELRAMVRHELDEQRGRRAP